ncbi:circularly permuted type 2 ATP-grasp protein [Corynebacterium nuruki]|uniref:circularly permuted type 2 ATP-grasp protein n=1 Tax=Corynebacterium nuruki TaxID=1032851 RepID=UPI0039BF056F
MDAAQMRHRLRAAHGDLRRRGVTFRAAGGDGHVVFPVDPLPRRIGEAEWDRLAAGVRQRARALDLFLDDVYGPAEILRAGVVPRQVLERSPEFRGAGELGRRVRPGGVRVHVYGSDLVQDAVTGRWCILEDNLRMPSGMTFALEARRMTQVHFPELLAGAPAVLDPSGALEEMCMTLRCAVHACTTGVEPAEAHVAVATEGPDDSTWAEQTAVARAGGFTLLAPAEMVVDADDHGVPALWDISGHISGESRRRIDVVYLRVVESRLPDRIGDAVAAGTVAVANAPGNGVADDKAVYTFVPAMVRHYLAEEPLLDQVRTWLCADPGQLAEVIDRVGELVVKPVDGYGGSGITVGPECTASQVAARREELRAAPERFIAQELVPLSTQPVLDGGERHVDLRMFAHLRDGASGVTASVAPVGLTRVAPGGSTVVNSSRGGGAKDTWIVAR